MFLFKSVYARNQQESIEYVDSSDVETVCVVKI